MLSRALSAIYVRWRKIVLGNNSVTVATVVVPLLLLTLTGTLSYRALEGWTLLEALYATIITITTVGYGDITPQTPGGRIFSIFFTLGAIGIASYAVSTLAATVIEKQAQRIENRIRRRRMQEIADLSEHTIICGASTFGYRAAMELRRRGKSFIIIDDDEEALRFAFMWMNPDYVSAMQRQFAVMERADIESYETRDLADMAADIDVLYIQADPMNEGTLLQAGIDRAYGVLTALDDDLDNIAIILSTRDIMGKVGNESLRVVSRVSEVSNIRRVYLAGADKVTAPNMLAGMQVVDSLLSEPMAQMWQRMMFNQANAMLLGEWRANEHPDWIGRTIDELRDTDRRLVTSIYRGSELMPIPRGDERIAKDDILITVSLT